VAGARRLRHGELRRGGLAVVVLVVVAQLIPVDRRNPSTPTSANPRSSGTPASAVDPSESIEAPEKLPPTVRAVLQGSCENCRSNRTAWPRCGYVAPVPWLIARDVQEWRKKLNLLEWAGASAGKRERKLAEICEQVTNGGDA